MKRSKNLSRQIAISALIAALYVALTYFSAAFGVAYGSVQSSIQFRLSEVLNVLALFTPAAIPGLTIGCLLGNITSPFGLLDILLGTFATFLSAVSIRIIGRYLSKSKPFFAIIPPTLFNAVLIGLEITFFAPNKALAVFFLAAAEVGLGELTVMTVLGIPFYYMVKNSKLSKLL